MFFHSFLAMEYAFAINNLNFYHFLQFTVGKPELITTCRNDHFLNNVPTSSFYRLMVIILVLSNM